MAAFFDTYIFVPAYNVEKTLATVLDKIPDSVWNRSKILVVNDGSRDGTESVFKNYLETTENSRRERLEYVAFEKNRGYGAVVKTGISKALSSGAQYVACLHGDGQYPADKLDEFLNRLENFRDGAGQKLALLQGSRHSVPGGAKAGHMPLYKRLGGTFLTAVENFAFKYKLTDRHSGFILYNAEFLRTVDVEKLSPSFDIDLELISLADSSGFVLGELPIPTVYAGEKSNLRVVDYGLRCLRQVYRRLTRR